MTSGLPSCPEVLDGRAIDATMDMAGRGGIQRDKPDPSAPLRIDPSAPLRMDLGLRSRATRGAEGVPSASSLPLHRIGIVPIAALFREG